MWPRRNQSLWDLIAPADAPAERFIADLDTRIAIRDLAAGRAFDAPPQAFRGRSVMISTERQLTCALALAELDGIARRVLLCPAELSRADIVSAMADAEIDAMVTDRDDPAPDLAPNVSRTFCGGRLQPCACAPERDVETEWVLFTSATTGRPKLAVHTLASLIGPLGDGLTAGRTPVWGTFYDIRRYGGLHILLRAFAGGGSMVLSGAGEPMADFLGRAGDHHVTHISGTPSHWRRALMSGSAGRMKPDYLRLSGEACDPAILDKLRRTYPEADIAHAFASTEAGVAFAVADGRAGFPTSLTEQTGNDVMIRVEDGSLCVRSPHAATRLLGDHARLPRDAAGFIDTGDMVDLRGGRYYFTGRREEIINVGGLKVHPETVEAVINQHPAVHMSRVSGRASPITGTIAEAEVVVNTRDGAAGRPFATVRSEILGMCRTSLAAHEVPVTVREVPLLAVAASGKLVRPHA